MPSYIKAFDAFCQECNKRFNINSRFTAVVNLDMVGFEKDEFLSGKLNKTICSHCQTEFTYEIPMIVFSMSMKFACLVEPGLDNNFANHIKNPPALILPDGFTYRIVRYQIEAKEKYDIFKNNCNDYIVEYIKLCSFSDESALPFDERNMIFKARHGDIYTFEQTDYNNKVLNQYTVSFPEEKIPDYIVKQSNKLNNNIWHKTDRISLKEELQCQNIKISL